MSLSKRKLQMYALRYKDLSIPNELPEPKYRVLERGMVARAILRYNQELQLFEQLGIGQEAKWFFTKAAQSALGCVP
eukprot:CAMPEP_0119324928 /NCGR_PEP_ID=MMETSP1333-20130426/64534_1 /TAXON_ID=418940 /ORGANISM="Scyphosphaera apsteinii, Strain RCC1455" /LENGTH=76 /DNA_ID=CAMNT_0007332763 /DNA_START=240 /DNA_END=470 /DNA_ORIENTATION=-